MSIVFVFEFLHFGFFLLEHFNSFEVITITVITNLVFISHAASFTDRHCFKINFCPNQPAMTATRKSVACMIFNLSYEFLEGRPKVCCGVEASFTIITSTNRKFSQIFDPYHGVFSADRITSTFRITFERHVFSIQQICLLHIILSLCKAWVFHNYHKWMVLFGMAGMQLANHIDSSLSNHSHEVIFS